MFPWKETFLGLYGTQMMSAVNFTFFAFNGIRTIFDCNCSTWKRTLTVPLKLEWRYGVWIIFYNNHRFTRNDINSFKGTLNGAMLCFPYLTVVTLTFINS